jgi:hypothetical protein
VSAAEFWRRKADLGIDVDAARALGREIAAGLSAEQIANVRAIIRNPNATRTRGGTGSSVNADTDHPGRDGGRRGRD